MNWILYQLVYVFLWLITLLPLPVLQLFSNLFYFLVYYVARYRRKDVYTNLQNSFPDKSPDEICIISKAFYRQLTDYFLEWMYRIHMGKKELGRRMYYKNPEILKPYLDKGRDVLLYLSHHGNWEWPTLISEVSGYTTLAIYKPLENKNFDKLFLRLRCKFGALGVPMASTLRTILEYRKEDTPVLVYTLADQRPEWGSIQHWTRFLNQDAPVIVGPEKIARKFNMVSIHLSINRIKRGYYEAEFQVLSEDSGKEKEFDITRKYLGGLEKTIREKPALYLWTHKRWKYHKKEVINPVDIGPIIS